MDIENNDLINVSRLDLKFNDNDLFVQILNKSTESKYNKQKILLSYFDYLNSGKEKLTDEKRIADYIKMAVIVLDSNNNDKLWKAELLYKLVNNEVKSERDKLCNALLMIDNRIKESEEKFNNLLIKGEY